MPNTNNKGRIPFFVKYYERGFMRKKDNLKNEIKNLKVQERRRKNKKIVEYNWIIKITIIAFLISLLFSFASEIVIPNVNIIVGIILVFSFIGIGILFDMVGVSVTSADIKPFNSMSSRKVRGSKIAVKMIKNADKVSSFCNDVIGDICGIVSGSAGVIIANSLSSSFNIDKFIITLIITAIIAALTIGGKALGKSFAINKNNVILYKFAKFLSYFVRK